jgi:hypothetical protein
MVMHWNLEMYGNGGAHMMKEDLITPAEMKALFAGNEEYSVESEEPNGAQELHSLQKVVSHLSKQVAELQMQLHEQFELQNKQQERFLRLCLHQLENKLHEQLVNTIEIHQQTVNQEYRTDGQQMVEQAVQPIVTPTETTENDADIELPFSRVKSYSKIRKRKKGFLEKLFE